jgi:glycosyltransferase involved in cell wall biosynthesis
MPFVSIVIPTYNRSAIVCDAVDNVLQQTYTHREVIIVDDGSTDDTVAQLARYKDRILLVVQPNRGPAAARNRGVACSRGELIAFQDSDDLWSITKLERQVALLRRAGTSVHCCLCNAALDRAVMGFASTFDLSEIEPSMDEGIWLNPAEVIASRFVLFNQCALIRRDMFEKLRGFREDIKYLEDYDFPLRLAMQGPWAFTREALTIVRQISHNSFSEQAYRDKEQLSACGLLLFEEALGRVPAGREYATLRRQLRRRVLLARRELSGCRMAKQGKWSARLMGSVQHGWNRCTAAAFRRSPWFPIMEAGPLPISSNT